MPTGCSFCVSAEFFKKLHLFLSPYLTLSDEGISGTNTKKRDEFNRMIMDCRAGKIDRIITKSISRFARNTLDCLNYVRELKTMGIGIMFEKEYIGTGYIWHKR